MAYIWVRDFKLGLDRRRPRVTGANGTLWDCKNAHLSRGGDIERAKKFVSTYSLPTGTYGLAQVRGQLFVFGSTASPGGMPAAVQYQQLDPGDGATVTRITDARSFAGNLYVIAEYSNGQVRHFYNGNQITSLNTLAASNSDYKSLAEYFAAKINARTDVKAVAYGTSVQITAVTAGTAFTLVTATTDGGGTNDQTAVITALQANVSAVSEVRATGAVTILTGSGGTGQTISSLLINGVELLASPVTWAASNANTATLLASGVMSGGSNYTASAVGNTVTINAPWGDGSAANGRLIAATTNGTVTVSASASLSGGVNAVAAVAQISRVTFGGTYEAADTFTLTVNGTAYIATGQSSGHGTFAFVYKKRVYQVANSLLRYCKLNDPSNWTDSNASSGAGFINLSNDSEGLERLVSLAQYQNYVAVYSRRNARVYQLETDATQNVFVQTLENTGTPAARSVTAYGNTDVFYLDETGVRSLRARDASNAAFVSDVGTAIDVFVRAYVNSQASDIVSRAVGLVEPTEGRYWLAIGARIFVLSYFPGAQITAWSYYEPGFTIDDMVRANSSVYVRSGNTIYLYGGASGEEYPAADEQTVTVELPFLSGEKPATMKMILGFDAALVNEWDIYLLPDASDETAQVHLGEINQITFSEGHIGINARGGLVSARMTCSRAGFASLSSIAVHFDSEEAR